MSRIRSIKPEFFTSETVARMPHGARLLFAGLWTHCDDEGRCKDSPAVIKGALFPYDEEVQAGTVDTWLGHLHSLGLVERYVVEGRRYLRVTGWEEHQKISHPGKSKIPMPCEQPQEDSGDPPEDSVSPPVILVPDLGSRIVGSRITNPPTPRRKASPATRWPEGFVLTDEMRDAAAARGMPRDVMDREFLAFKDWAEAKDARYRDWAAAWRTRASNYLKFNPSTNGTENYT